MIIPKRVYDEAAFVQAASPLAIQKCMKEVVKRIRRYKRWLNEFHPYNNDIAGVLTNQTQVDPPKLGEYIASSVPLHLADGWNYLSRALEAASRGDRGSAYHLAYYAELRAAMSLLATEGVGIFHYRHFALDDHLQPTEFRASTHRATWKILTAWSNEAGRASILLEGLTIEGKSLSEWLQMIGVVEPAQRVLASKWLGAWSVDLQVFSDDRTRRNEVSYRPSRIRFPMPPSLNSLDEQVFPILNSWSELEPFIGGTKATLDLSLLREAISLAVDQGVCHYSTMEAALASLEGHMQETTFDALALDRPSARAIFDAAAATVSATSSAAPILARSLLMLRLASAYTSAFLSAAHVSKADLEFWWAPLGKDLGLWDNADDVVEFADLWADVEDAKVEVEAQVSAPSSTGTVREVAMILNRDVSLTQFARASMWLLGLE